MSKAGPEVLKTFSGKAGRDLPAEEQECHLKSWGQVTSWKPPHFFRETQIIQEYVVLRSPVLHLLEFILEAVFYGKYLPILSLCLVFWLVYLPVFLTVKESQTWGRANESFPLFLSEQGNDFQNVTFKISSKNSNKHTEKPSNPAAPPAGTSRALWTLTCTPSWVKLLHLRSEIQNWEQTEIVSNSHISDLPMPKLKVPL